MKTIVPLLTILLFFACNNAANNNEKEVNREQGFPKFEFQEELHNFGNLKAGEIVVYSFKFNNSGSNVLYIQSAESDCGCVTVEFPKEGISPGENGYIEITFNSAGEVGKVYKEIQLTSNSEEKEITLVITANIENELLNIYTIN